MPHPAPSSLALSLFLIAFGFALVTLLRYCAEGPSWPKSFAKTASVALLALAVLASGFMADEALVWPLVAALSLGAVGDYCLSRPSERAFLLGLGAFALAHLAYVLLFLGLGAEGQAIMHPGRALAALALIGFALFMARLLWRHSGQLRGPVMIYIGVITLMGLAALALPGSVWWLIPAAGLFLLSDTLLALELFVPGLGGRLHRMLPYGIWLSYWMAQAWFAAGGLWGRGVF